MLDAAGLGSGPYTTLAPAVGPAPNVAAGCAGDSGRPDASAKAPRLPPKLPMDTDDPKEEGEVAVACFLPSPAARPPALERVAAAVLILRHALRVEPGEPPMSLDPMLKDGVPSVAALLPPAATEADPETGTALVVLGGPVGSASLNRPIPPPEVVRLKDGPAGMLGGVGPCAPFACCAPMFVPSPLLVPTPAAVLALVACCALGPSDAMANEFVRLMPDVVPVVAADLVDVEGDIPGDLRTLRSPVFPVDLAPGAKSAPRTNDGPPFDPSIAALQGAAKSRCCYVNCEFVDQAACAERLLRQFSGSITVLPD